MVYSTSGMEDDRTQLRLHLLPLHNFDKLLKLFIGTWEASLSRSLSYSEIYISMKHRNIEKPRATD